MNSKINTILEDLNLSYTPCTETEPPVDTPASVSGTGTVMSARERRAINRQKWMDTALDFDFVKFQNARLCGMKRIGISHIKDEKPCQDSFLIYSGGELGVEIITAADGHGDSKHDLSEYGSQLACRAVRDTVLKALNAMPDATEYMKTLSFKEDIVITWKEYVLRRHRERFPDDSSNIAHILTRYGTTLLFAVHYRGKLFVGRLGDGGIILSSGEEVFSLFAVDDKLGTSTSSMCSEASHMLLNIKIYDEREIDGIMLMTDGMFDIFTDNRYLYDNMKVFISGMKDDSLFPDAYFREQYNKYVEYITDDATVCMMTLENTRTASVMPLLESLGAVPDSVSFRENSIKVSYSKCGERLTAIFSRAFLPVHREDDELFGFLNPSESFMSGDYVCCIYPDSGADDYKNIYSLIDEMIKSKKTKIYDKKLYDIIGCLYGIATSGTPDLLCADAGLLLELIEYSEKENGIRIFRCNEKESGKIRYQTVIAKLLLYILAGGIINCDNRDLQAVLEGVPQSASANLLRAGRGRLSDIISVINGIPVENSCCTAVHRCRQCKSELLAYEGLSACPVCRAETAPRAIISTRSGDINEYLCENTSVIITLPDKSETVAEVIINPGGGQLGLKNSSDTVWFFPDEDVYVNPGQIKGILKSTTLRVNSFDLSLELL